MTLGHNNNNTTGLPVTSANVSSKLVILNPPPVQQVQHLHYIHHDQEEEDEEEVDEVYEVDPDYHPNEESDEGYRTTSSVTSGEKLITIFTFLICLINIIIDVSDIKIIVV